MFGLMPPAPEWPIVYASVLWNAIQSVTEWERTSFANDTGAAVLTSWWKFHFLSISQKMISQKIDTKQEKLLCFEALSEKITLAWIFSTIRDQELSTLLASFFRHFQCPCVVAEWWNVCTGAPRSGGHLSSDLGWTIRPNSNVSQLTALP